MKKILLLGKNLEDIRPKLAHYNLLECDQVSEAELVIAHGGDGTLLQAEFEFPGLPKLPLRDAATAPLCSEHSLDKLLSAYANGELKITYLNKVEAVAADGSKVSGINDVFLHNAQRGRALRYKVAIDGELYAREIVGDGVGLASVHGSTAYYRSITHSVFRTGIGLAFSNSTELVNHLVLPQNSTVEITIIRGPGVLVGDYAPIEIPVAEGETIILHQAPEQVPVYALAEFMCPACRELRHPKPLPYAQSK